tara:strand:- start:16472 stop:16939 length:468 start_codon:yes stop_codon:yes gene_type:complete
MKTSIITHCKFSGDWKAPNGDILYFHNIELKNGDAGNVATAEKYASKIDIGKEVSYTINDKMKIKLQQDEGHNNTPDTYNGSNSSENRQPSKYTPKAKRSYAKKPEDFLGYACSYAKDLVVAGKATAKDIKAYEAAAEKIYAHVKKLLNEEEEED